MGRHGRGHFGAMSHGGKTSGSFSGASSGQLVRIVFMTSSYMTLYPLPDKCRPRFKSQHNIRTPKPYKDNVPSVSILANCSFAGTSLEPVSGCPDSHPVDFIIAIQISATGTPSDWATSRHASAYSLVLAAVRLGVLKPFSASKYCVWCSLTGGGVRTMILVPCSLTAGCCIRNSRFSLYWSRGTCCACGGNTASFAPKNIVYSIVSLVLRKKTYSKEDDYH